MRKLAVGVVLLALCVLFWYSVLVPFRTNRLVAELQNSTTIALQSPLPATGARKNVRAASTALVSARHSAVLHVLKAANLRILGKNREATESYERAIAIEPRPETYWNLAMTLLEIGSRDDAVAAMASAIEASPDLMDDITDSMLRKDVAVVIASREPDRQNLLHNPGFHQASGAGSVVRVSGSAYGIESPARGWLLLNLEGTLVVNRTKSPNGYLMRVVSSHPGGSLEQLWRPLGLGPMQVATTVEIRVTRGRVAIGSGWGRTSHQNILVSPSTAWESIRTMSSSCPVGVTTLSAVERDTEFEVRHVDVRKAGSQNTCRQFETVEARLEP